MKNKPEKAKRKFNNGDIVSLKARFAQKEHDCLAYVYEEYDGGDYEGISIITEDGRDLGGFTAEEQELCLSFVRSTGAPYEFKNVSQLGIDFKGKIKPFFGKAL